MGLPLVTGGDRVGPISGGGGRGLVRCSVRREKEGEVWVRFKRYVRREKRVGRRNGSERNGLNHIRKIESGRREESGLEGLRFR